MPPPPPATAGACCSADDRAASVRRAGGHRGRMRPCRSGRAGLTPCGAATRLNYGLGAREFTKTVGAWEAMSGRAPFHLYPEHTAHTN